MKKEQDILLWSSIQNGDTAAFRELYNSYFDVLLGSILKHVKVRQDAEDILQDVFFTLWQNRQQINIQTSLFSYIYSIMRFKVLRYFKGQKMTHEQNTTWLALAAKEDTTLLPDQDDENEQWSLLKKNVDQLPLQLKKVYSMHIEQGESVATVAEELALSRHTVKNYLKDIRKRFRVAANTELSRK